jgi:predicted amidohydrolase YtcJ
MQPAHLLTDIPLVERHWGGRGAGAYAFRSLAERQTILAYGSDAPVASIDPRQGIYAATARRAADGSPRHGWYPGQRLTFEEALTGYAVGNAVAAGVASHRGRLAPGFDADLVAWDIDPGLADGAPEAVRDARVRLTVVAGEIVMRS